MIGGRLRQLFHRFRGRLIEFDLAPYRRLLAQIDAQEERLKATTDARLKEMSAQLAAGARAGTALDDLLAEAFALAREVSHRVLGMRHFDVQMLGGIAIHRGRLAEMQTGEGKTLVAVLPVYLNALTGDGVHVLTFNDYLARRDAGWMGPVYEFLGLTVGYVQEGMDPDERQRAYRCAVTYATAKEAGFDYLRDHRCIDKNNLVHRPFHFALVDEADSILIDEARIPLVIAGNTDEVATNPYAVADLVQQLRSGLDYGTDQNRRNVYLTESGVERAEAVLGCANLHAEENLALVTQLHHALHAHVLLARDVDYVVKDSQVQIVDEFTGRVVEDRHWPDGLQAAVEAKEDLPIQAEGMIRGSITLIHLARMYPKLAGMTATAQAAAEEFNAFYDLAVTVIPPHRPCVRSDETDLVFLTEQAKQQALVEEIARVHATGRPVLVGTSSVAESDSLAETLQQRGLTCQVLNARNDEREAEIVAEAGAPSAVTISTNMAGRGTDIRLGGNSESFRDTVVALGGLYVIGTNRHESRRIDDQLRGRAGRQGDPGSSRFIISLEDDLLRRFGADEIALPPDTANVWTEPIDDPEVTHEIAHVQRVMEGQNLQIRRMLWQYSYVVERQREIVHGRRQDLLLEKTAPALLAGRCAPRYERLLAQVGPAVLKDVERQITLFHIDRCWAEYLDYVHHIREGLCLTGGGGNPLDMYHRTVGKAFRELLESIDDHIVETFTSAEIGANGIDMDKEGLRGPSSTWTYLITDNPFGNWFERLYRTVTHSEELFRSLRRALVYKSS